MECSCRIRGLPLSTVIQPAIPSRSIFLTSRSGHGTLWSKLSPSQAQNNKEAQPEPLLSLSTGADRLPDGLLCTAMLIQLSHTLAKCLFNSTDHHLSSFLFFNI